MSEENIINVNMAAMNVATPPRHLRTVLGSCVGVFLYEPRLKLGGLVHIMLPDAPEGAAPGSFNPAKFATSGIPALIDLMQKEGAVKKNLVCKICGGAKMFAGFSANSVVDIGSRNQTAVIDTLAKAGLKIVARDVGGTSGRKILADLETGLIKIMHFNVGEKVI